MYKYVYICEERLEADLLFITTALDSLGRQILDNTNII